ncbi:MAG: hypothetical protein ABEL97_10735, partial [Salinibacter sp.]
MSTSSQQASTGAGWQIIGIFLALNLLLRLPKLLLGELPLPLSDGAGMFYWEGPLRLLSLDLFALVSLLALVPPHSAWGRRARAFAVGALGVLLGYEAYGAVVQTALHRDPLLYADSSHLVGAAHLAYNAVSLWQGLLGVVGGGAAIYALIRVIPPTVRRLHQLVWAPG